MPLDGLVGREYRTAAPYLVAAERLTAFADAVGEPAAVCHDAEAARAAGYADVVAPPTFAVVPAFRGLDAVLADPTLGIELSRVVHGEQAFVHHRPIVARDALTTVATVTSARLMRGSLFLTVSAEVVDAAGLPVCTATSTIVVGGVSA
jgi:acyl dehydratase